MNKKTKEIKEPEFSDELRALFPELAEEGYPTKAEVKAKVIELHEAGDQANAAELMKWQELRNEKAPLTKTQKSTQLAIFIMLVIIGILSVFWFVYQADQADGTKIVVCSISGQTFMGDDCNVEPSEPAQDSTESTTDNDGGIFSGDTTD